MRSSAYSSNCRPAAETSAEANTDATSRAFVITSGIGTMKIRNDRGKATLAIHSAPKNMIRAE